MACARALLIAACWIGAAHAATVLYVYDELGRLVAEIDPAAENTDLLVKSGRNLTATAWALCALAYCSLATGTTIDEWVAKNTERSEKLLCKQQLDGEYFFVARTGDKVKLGARLDMTDYATAPAFIVGWTFKNENDQSLTTKVRPIPVMDNYVKAGGKAFIESVEYQTLRLSGSRTMRVTIDIEKCSTSECDRRTKGPKEKEYVVKVCEVSLAN